MSDDPQKAEMKELNGKTPANSENGTGPLNTSPIANGAAPQEPLTNGAVTRNKRVCRRKAAYKDDYTTIAANQVTRNLFHFNIFIVFSDVKFWSKYHSIHLVQAYFARYLP